MSYQLTEAEAVKEAARMGGAWVQRRPFDGRCNVSREHPGTWMVPVFWVDRSGKRGGR